MTNLQSVPGYRALAAARVLSSAILWVDFTLVFSLLGYYWHADATTIGVASALYGLPGLVLGPFFGALADRVNPVAMRPDNDLLRGHGAKVGQAFEEDQQHKEVNVRGEEQQKRSESARQVADGRLQPAWGPPASRRPARRAGPARAPAFPTRMLRPAGGRKSWPR